MNLVSNLNGNINNTYYPDNAHDVDWKAAAIPVDSAVALSAAAAGIVPEDGVKSSKDLESSSTSDTSDFSHSKDFDKESTKNTDDDNNISETSESQNRSPSPDVGVSSSSGAQCLEIFGASQSLFRCHIFLNCWFFLQRFMLPYFYFLYE